MIDSDPLKTGYDRFSTNSTNYWAEAEEAYRLILAHQPHSEEALCRVAKIRAMFGDWRRVLTFLNRAASLAPENAFLQREIGKALEQEGSLLASLSHYRRASYLKPDDIEALFSLAIALEKTGHTEEAQVRYRQIICVAPDRPEAYANLGALFGRKSRLDESLECLLHATNLDPNRPEIKNSLGLVYSLKGALAKATEVLISAIVFNPSFTPAYINLGDVQRKCGLIEDAIATLTIALSLQRDAVPAHVGLAAALADYDRFFEATVAVQRAIALDPSSANGYSGLGYILCLQNRYHDAMRFLTKAIHLETDFVEAHHSLALATARTGHLDASVAAHERTLQLSPTRNDVHSELLFLLHNDHQCSGDVLYKSHKKWADIHAKSLPRAPGWTNSRDPNKQLRIGYVSPDFKKHSIAFFLEPLLSAHDRTKHQIFCYSNVARADRMTARFISLSDIWRQTHSLSDEEMADLIRHDEIDILIDLALHTAGNRLLVFARKPAPIQITYLGYPGTSGLPTIDYKLTDRYIDPPGLSESFHSEALLRLPSCYFCYSPHDLSSTAVGPLPANCGNITFSVFQTLLKIRPEMVELWGAILRAVPRSRLWIKALGLQEEATRAMLRERLTRLGVNGDRLLFEGWSDLNGYIAALQHTDIALDTYPFNGGTTTCHSLWMGVPVVTLAGTTPTSRMGLSLLNNVGFHDLIALTPAKYVNIAVALANDIPRLTRIRQELRHRMLNSAVMDARKFALDVEASYRHVWRKWCRTI